MICGRRVGGYDDCGCLRESAMDDNEQHRQWMIDGLRGGGPGIKNPKSREEETRHASAEPFDVLESSFVESSDLFQQLRVEF